MEKKKRKYSRTDRLILGIGFTILGLFVLSIAIPIIYVVLASFMDPTVLNNQGLSSDIKDWTLDAYRRVLENEMIWRGFLNSFLYSFAFTVISVFVTLLAAFPLSKKEFVGRKFFNLIFLITMFFGGGMIPTFILINQLHMVNTVWAVLIPGAFNVWNMILARTYYQSIPAELREASAIDGANEIQHFFKIMMPGKVAVFSAQQKTKSVQDRVEGFMNNIGKYGDIEVVETIYSDQVDDMEASMKEVLEKYPTLDGVFCTNADITEMYLNLEKSDEHDAPALVGVDATTKQQEAIRNGEEIGCVSQQPYAMGYQTIWAAVETTAPKKSVVIEKNVLSNPAWIDADCLDDPDYSGYLYTE